MMSMRDLQNASPTA